MIQAVTEQQTHAIEQFIEALKNLDDCGVAIVRANEDDSLHFFNGQGIRQFVAYDDRDSYPEAADITDYASPIELGCIINHAYYPSEDERVLAVLG